MVLRTAVQLAFSCRFLFVGELRSVYMRWQLGGIFDVLDATSAGSDDRGCGRERRPSRDEPCTRQSTPGVALTLEFSQSVGELRSDALKRLVG